MEQKQKPKHHQEAVRSGARVFARAFFLPIAVSTLLLGFLSERAMAARDITGYNPSRACPGTRVDLLGSGLGAARIAGETIRYGNGVNVQGQLPNILSWSNARITVVLPSAIRSGTYWVRVYQGESPAGRSPEGLVIRGDCPGPAAIPPSLGKAVGEADRRKMGLAGPAPRVTPPASTSYTAMVNVLRVYAFDDCDSVSAGDWILFFDVEGTRPDGSRVTNRSDWPHGEISHDVDTATTVTVGEGLQLGPLSPTSSITFNMTGVDCDSDTWLPTSYVETFGGSRECGGEEFPEVSGANDRLGSARLTLTPEQWQRGGDFRVEGHEGACGYRAFLSVSARVNPMR